MYMIEDILLGKYNKCIKGLDIYENSNSLILSKIIIEDECRGEGVGTKVMTDLIDYADSNGQIVALTPSSDFGGNKNRLIQFYKRFGFKMNKGANKNFEFRDTMIREPLQPGQKKVYESTKDKLRGGLADKMSKKDIAKKFNVTLAKINKEVDMGVEVELEHVNTRKLAKEIAMDHLVEIPDYYTRLKKMEKEGKNHWKSKMNESTKDFIKRRIRESIDLSVTDETPKSTTYYVNVDGNPIGIVAVGKFNPKLNDDELEILELKVNEEYRSIQLGIDVVQTLWNLFPDVNRFLLMTTPESRDYWEKVGATRLNSTYHMINKGH